MLFDQNRAFQGTSAGFLVCCDGVLPLLRRQFLFLDANEHLRKEVAFQLLPGLLVLSNSYSAMQAQFTESKGISRKQQSKNSYHTY